MVSIYGIKGKASEPDSSPFFQLLGFDPKTHPQEPCWIWPHSINKRGEPILPGNRNPLRSLVEYVNDHPLPRHPYTGRHLHIIRPCHLNKLCVNPFHIQRVHPLRDSYETIKNDPSFAYPEPRLFKWF